MCVTNGLSECMRECVSVKRVVGGEGGFGGVLIPTTSEANRARDVTQ